MGAYADLTIDQGSDFMSTFDLVADDGNPIDVTGYVFSGQIRKSYYSTNPTANIDIVITNAVNGNTYIALSANVTSNISPGRYLYDIKMKSAANVTSRVIEGIMTVTPQVTKS